MAEEGLGDIQVYLLTSDSCQGCEAAKKKLTKELADGTVKELNIDKDPEAATVISALDIRAVPELVFARKTKDGKIHVCTEIGTKDAKCAEFENIQEKLNE